MIYESNFHTVDRRDIEFLFPALPDRINKGDMGRVLCICGSYEKNGSAMSGAAYFSASAAYKCGAGIVEIFTHRKNYESLASLVPEAVFSLYDTEIEDANSISERLRSEIKKADSIVLGCGLGKSELAKALVKTTLDNADCPLVIDADGLNILAENKELQELVRARKNDTVITPHPGEMSRLSGIPIPKILADTDGIAVSLAKNLKITVLLKDHETVITDGDYTFKNQSGNAGMASAGMGDVLSGIIGAMLAHSRVSDDISQERFALPFTLYRTATAAYIHGLSGDRARDELCEYSITASDVLKAIPRVLRPQK